jgi:hypothetical protein
MTMATPDPVSASDLTSDLAPDSAGQNQRKHPRRVLRNSAQIRISGGEAVHVSMLDIGAGGFSIVTSANPKPNTACAALLTIPVKPYGGTPVEVQATVVYSVYSSIDAGFKVGLKFTKLSPEGYAAIAEFVNG